ncbi:MAG: hypothetical protein LBE98_00585 [Puniceicoccales bacterium]|jgi:hypothetical protein|nr:hypothetical protein [Puniceicoccales bacterium]
MTEIHVSTEIYEALFDQNTTINGYQDIESLLSIFHENKFNVRSAIISKFNTTVRAVSPGHPQRVNLLRCMAGNGFAFMLVSLAKNSKDGIAFPRQGRVGSIVIKNVSFEEQLQSDFQEICGFLNDSSQGKIAKSKYAKRFPFLEHCHLLPNENVMQKAEAMLSWLQTSGNVNIFNNLEMQRMFCKLLCGDANNPKALAGALKDRATREQFVRIVDQFFEAAFENLPNPVKTEEDMQKYKFYASLHIQLNETIKNAGEPKLSNNIFARPISSDGTVNEELKLACVLCRKMIQGEKLTTGEILKCTDPKMMIWPEMAGASDALLERDPEDSSGIKNMFEGVSLEALKDFVIDQVDRLAESDFQAIGQQYAQQQGYGDCQVTVDGRLITIKGQDDSVKASIDLNNFVRLVDGIHPEEHVKTKDEEHPILRKLGIDGTNIRSRVKVEGSISTVDGRITIDNRTNKVTMGGKVLVTPRPFLPWMLPTATDHMLTHFLSFVAEGDTACEKIYLYDPTSMDQPVFILKNGKLYTSDESREYVKPSDVDPRLEKLSSRGINILETIDPETKEVLSYVVPGVHYNNQVLQFKRQDDGELYLASDEQYVLSRPPVVCSLYIAGDVRYVCLRSKDNPNDYKFVLVNGESLLGSLPIDNKTRQETPTLRQDTLEIGFNLITGFDLASSNYQTTGIILVGKLFQARRGDVALDILSKINMREVIAGRNNALLSLVFRPLVTDTSDGKVLKINTAETLKEKLATFKIITLLLESAPYNFRNLLLARDDDGAIRFKESFNLIMQISSLYQSLIDARKNSTMEINLSKENELAIVEEIIGAMNQALQAAPKLAQKAMNFFTEETMLNLVPEYGLLKLFEQRHQILVEELGTQSDVKHFTRAAKDSKEHDIVYYQPGGKRSFVKASEISSVLPTRNTEMLAKLRQEAQETALLQTPANIERRKSFLRKCCRSDAEINNDQELTPQQKTDYIAFRNAMGLPQLPEGNDTNNIIIGSIEKVYISEIEDFLRNQPTKNKHSEALDRENNVRRSIMPGILQPIKTPQADVQPSGSPDLDKYKTSVLLDLVKQDEKAIQSNGALNKNDRRLILAFKQIQLKFLW